MRKALVVGIDHYKQIPSLYGCVNDARSVAKVMESNSDGSPNFDVRLIVGTGPKRSVSRKALKEMVRELFTGNKVKTALFYFAGHGYLESTGGYLLTSECRTGDDGLALSEVLTLAHDSEAENKVIVLDSCHSGHAGAKVTDPGSSELNEGTTILTASTAKQYATEENGAGVFTTLFVDALEGAAANLVGQVTPGSAYAHIDQSLGSWEQRPLFKTNVREFVSLRQVEPPIKVDELRQLLKLFPTPDYDFPLNPSYEPESERPNPKNTVKLAMLQKYNRVNLVVPVGAQHMYFAAMESKSCRLTPLGQHYWRLVKKKRI